MANSALKLLIGVLLIVLGLLQYKLWWAPGGMHEYQVLKKTLQVTQQRNAQLTQHNQQLIAEIQYLKTSKDSIEEQARSNLGMVKRDETFYEIVPKVHQSG